MTQFLTADRIYLREVRLSDVGESYHQWMNDPAVNSYLETRFVPQSMEMIEDFVRSKQGDRDEPFFAICLRETDQHIGNIKLGPINWVHRHADVSLLVGDRDQWGKGYASEAIGLVCRFAFQNLDLHKLKAGSYAANEGSIRAFEKNGWSREGLLREHVHHDGDRMDVVLLGVTADEWRAQS